jgi:hypothetical protein
MSPFVRNRDVIVIEPLRGGPVRVGDVAAFVAPELDTLMVHRVVRERMDAYLMKADNAPHADGWVPRDLVLGHVNQIERHGKRVHLGLGSERRLIAWLSRRGLLLPAMEAFRGTRRYVRRLGTAK